VRTVYSDCDRVKEEEEEEDDDDDDDDDICQIVKKIHTLLNPKVRIRLKTPLLEPILRP
jgi:hypothetical protein